MESLPPSTVFHIAGDNPRVNFNSTDNSVNVVIKTSEQIFASLRQTVESGVPEGDEQQGILEKLTALEKAQGSKSFGERYAEFVAVAANHMGLIGPFIPALTELLHKVL
jgi:hypothetical protein